MLVGVQEVLDALGGDAAAAFMSSHGLADPESEAAALVALRYTYFHWGFNGWAMYAVMGGAMAYFSFRKGLPTLVSATFTPILGPNASERPIGRLVVTWPACPI